MVTDGWCWGGGEWVFIVQQRSTSSKQRRFSEQGTDQSRCNLITLTDWSTSSQNDQLMTMWSIIRWEVQVLIETRVTGASEDMDPACLSLLKASQVILLVNASKSVCFHHIFTIIAITTAEVWARPSGRWSQVLDLGAGRWLLTSLSLMVVALLKLTPGGSVNTSHKEWSLSMMSQFFFMICLIWTASLLYNVCYNVCGFGLPLIWDWAISFSQVTELCCEPGWESGVDALVLWSLWKSQSESRLRRDSDRVWVSEFVQIGYFEWSTVLIQWLLKRWRCADNFLVILWNLSYSNLILRLSFKLFI